MHPVLSFLRAPWRPLMAVPLLLALHPGALSAADAPSTNAPARRAPQGPLVSPELLADGGVTFRLRAPKATEVKVSGQFGKDAAMVRDTNGVWSVTVPSVPAGCTSTISLWTDSARWILRILR